MRIHTALRQGVQSNDDAFSLASRYPDEHNDVLIDKLAKINGVNHDQILLGDGRTRF